MRTALCRLALAIQGRKQVFMLDHASNTRTSCSSILCFFVLSYMCGFLVIFAACYRNVQNCGVLLAGGLCHQVGVPGAAREMFGSRSGPFGGVRARGPEPFGGVRGQASELRRAVRKPFGAVRVPAGAAGREAPCISFSFLSRTMRISATNRHVVCIWNIKVNMSSILNCSCSFYA